MRHDYSMHSANPSNLGEGTIQNDNQMEIVSNPAPVNNPYQPDNQLSAVQVSPVPLRSATLVENAQKPYTYNTFQKKSALF